MRCLLTAALCFAFLAPALAQSDAIDSAQTFEQYRLNSANKLPAQANSFSELAAFGGDPSLNGAKVAAELRRRVLEFRAKKIIALTRSEFDDLTRAIDFLGDRYQKMDASPELIELLLLIKRTAQERKIMLNDGVIENVSDQIQTSVDLELRKLGPLPLLKDMRPDDPLSLGPSVGPSLGPSLGPTGDRFLDSPNRAADALRAIWNASPANTDGPKAPGPDERLRGAPMPAHGTKEPTADHCRTVSPANLADERGFILPPVNSADSEDAQSASNWSYDPVAKHFVREVREDNRVRLILTVHVDTPSRAAVFDVRYRADYVFDRDKKAWSFQGPSNQGPAAMQRIDEMWNLIRSGNLGWPF